MEQVKRTDTTAGFVPVKRRWVVEQTNGALMLLAMGADQVSEVVQRSVGQRNRGGVRQRRGSR